jgi:hypothetical protein
LWSLLVFPAWARAQEDFSPPKLTGDGLELEAAFEAVTDTVYGLEKEAPPIRNFGVAIPRQRHVAAAFVPFLPATPVKVGDTWPVSVPDLVPLLRQFHAGASAELHHQGVGSPGGWACLRTLGETQAEICFRIHAEFLLEGDGDFTNSSWLTPAQFRGRLVLDRKTGAVTGFRLEVPDQLANVDMNVATAADIGRIPKMELVGGTLADVVNGEGGLAEDEARQLLARQFYPFAQLDWFSLEEALAQSRATGKPMHIIALFGSLDDESC